MSFYDLATFVTDETIDATRMNEARLTIAFLGALQRAGVTLGALAASTDIRGPEYDSGWNALALSTTYTKAHGLSATPTRCEVWHAAVASPGAGDEIVLAHITINAGLYKNPLGMDGTNIYYQTGDTTAVSNMRRTTNTGYFRILAWD